MSTRELLLTKLQAQMWIITVCYITLCCFIYSLNWCLCTQTNTLCGYLTNSLLCWLHSEICYGLLLINRSVYMMCSQFCMISKENVPVFVKDRYNRTLTPKKCCTAVLGLFCKCSTRTKVKGPAKLQIHQNPSINKDGKALSWNPKYLWPEREA